ncbi:MAG: hypothetical protein WCD72_01600 [Dehalococcoidia bacterium]
MKLEPESKEEYPENQERKGWFPYLIFCILQKIMDIMKETGNTWQEHRQSGGYFIERPG